MPRGIFDYEITGPDELESAANEYGLLPFFYCGMPGFSVEELTPPQYWFAGDVDGPWEWRMEVSRRGGAGIRQAVRGQGRILLA